MIGTILAGRYRIEAPLGEGGMAVVYKAMDIVLNRVVAIKALRAQYAGDNEFVERFRREAQAAASLSHPNVVNIFDVGQTDGVHYIVLEYVQGQNLKEILRRDGRQDPRRAARIAAAVARALQAAHERQLVHRDIKPHNILITPEGRVKVTDFGIARATSSATLTETGMVIGSVHYFSPEQARGNAVGPAADLYSLGIVLYEMLTGQVPFHGESPVAVALKHLQDTPRPPTELVKTIPPWLEQVVLKALAKDPAHRYRSAAQMAIDLAWRNPGAALSSDLKGTGGLHVLRPDAVAGSRTPTTAMAANDWTEGDPGAAGGAEPRGFDPKSRPPPIIEEDVAGVFGGRERLAAANEDAGGMPPPGKRRWGWLITFILLIFMVGGVFVATPLLLDVIFPPEVNVPGLTGLTYDQARPLAQAAGLLLKVDAEVFDRHVPAGAIVRQTPEEGRTVRKGREVGVVLSRGPEIGLLPDVTGRTIRDARVLLTQAGFTLGAEEVVPDAEAPVNEVVAQDPDAGASLEKGSPVTLWVSRPGPVGATQVKVPDLRGSLLAAAESQVAGLGLVVGNKWAERNLLVPPGRVIDQNPPSGTMVAAGTVVDFVYSDGPAGDTTPSAVPDFEFAKDFEIGLDADIDFGEDPPPGTDARVDGRDGGVSDDKQMEADADDEANEARVDWDTVLRAEAAEGGRRRAKVDVYIPPGAPREVVVLVIDDFGVREVLRQTVQGDTHVERLIEGRGEQARLQVYVDGVMQIDEPFPEL